MIPYRNIESLNLGLLLFISRAFVYLALALIVFSIVSPLVIKSFIYSLSFVPIFVVGISLLVISGLLAGLVSFEENFRKQTVHLVSQSSTNA